MNKKLIAGNWKMNMNRVGASALIAQLIPYSTSAIETVLCVPFTLIDTARAAVGHAQNIAVGGQNVAWANSGAFTGEISADMLIEAGASYVIIGHSERRAMFGETDQTVNLRLTTALQKGLTPIVCIGESLIEREQGRTEQILAAQLSGGLQGITKEEMSKIVLAYEPIWAIGTGKTATAAQASDAAGFIKKFTASLFGNDAAIIQNLRVLYGGSMNAANAGELLSMPHIDGGLIGGASLKAADFSAIMTAAANAK